MSTVEHRLLRDIATVTGGVVVTDSDLRNARAAIDERIDGDRWRARRRAVIAAAAATVVVVAGVAAFLTRDGDDLSAPPADRGGTSTPSTDPHAEFLTGNAPTSDDVQGIWRQDNAGVLMRFAPPDLVSFDRGGRLFDNPGVQGRYAIDGDVITITVDGGPAGCGGQTIAMRASVPEPGKLNVVYTEPGAGICAGRVDERWTLDQVLPTSASLGALDLSGEPGWQPLTISAALHGTWLAEGGGYVLELDRDGVYHVATGSGEQVDYGEWSLRASRLTLTSRPDSVECSVGDRLVLGGVEYVDPGTRAIRATVRENTCGAAWTPRAWILIPHEGG